MFRRDIQKLEITGRKRKGTATTGKTVKGSGNQVAVAALFRKPVIAEEIRVPSMVVPHQQNVSLEFLGREPLTSGFC